MTLAEEAEIRVKRYDGLNDDDASVMQISVVPCLEGQRGQPGNNTK